MGLTIVTGGAGFIGSNLVRAMNEYGVREVAVVDHLSRPEKLANLAGSRIVDFWDKEEFLNLVEGEKDIGKIDAIMHLGACTDTTDSDGPYLMRNNFTYSKKLLHYALIRGIPLVYASSGAVYGHSGECREEPACERPLNIYGYSKLLFDEHVRCHLPSVRSTLVGLRFFNVYGPGEHHKGRMASMVHQIEQQITTSGKARLFQGSGEYADGEQRRDFVWVGDVVAVCLYFLDKTNTQGIYNVGTGEACSFNEVYRCWRRLLGRGELEYIPFPHGLVEKYQRFTQADMGQLRRAGYTQPFLSLEQGMTRFHEAFKG